MTARKLGRPPNPNSMKGNPDWVAATFYIKWQTKGDMEQFLHLAKMDAHYNQKADHPASQSELIDRAITAWLKSRLPKMRKRVSKHITR